ncbi:hypothetical protein [Streptomyces sp. NPDC004284]|uniref:hypothetical protein n=1 Tax=Streptomyces sp. NPDC004284 TaxID=3364695 RepID=UPI0036C7C70B
MGRWRRQWRGRGEAGVLSKGSPGRPRLSDAQIARLERERERGRWFAVGPTSGGRRRGSGR